MEHKKKVLHCAKISKAKFRQILRLFVLDLTAKQITAVVGLNRNTINRYLTIIRTVIANECEKQELFNGEVEVDESYFGSRYRKKKESQKRERGRGTNKTKVFGICKRNGKVYTNIVPNCKAKTLQQVICRKVSRDSTIFSDEWKGYDGLVALGYKSHFRINHSTKLARKERGCNVHINGIEGFWGIAKSRLLKFKGMHSSTFYLHLKETEFRFNNRDKNIYKILLSLFKKYNVC